MATEVSTFDSSAIVFKDKDIKEIKKKVKKTKTPKTTEEKETPMTSATPTAPETPVVAVVAEAPSIPVVIQKKRKNMVEKTDALIENLIKLEKFTKEWFQTTFGKDKNLNIKSKFSTKPAKKPRDPSIPYKKTQYSLFSDEYRAEFLKHTGKNPTLPEVAKAWNEAKVDPNNKWFQVEKPKKVKRLPGDPCPEKGDNYFMGLNGRAVLKTSDNGALVYAYLEKLNKENEPKTEGEEEEELEGELQDNTHEEDEEGEGELQDNPHEEDEEEEEEEEEDDEEEDEHPSMR